MIQKRGKGSPEKKKQRIAPRASHPASAPSFQGRLHPILQLQQILGNQQVTQLIQAKLTVSHAGDRDEGEADRGTEQVTLLPSPESSPIVQRQPKKVDPGTFKPRKMTLEDVVKEMNGLGGPYKDLKAWTDTFKPGKF